MSRQIIFPAFSNFLIAFGGGAVLGSGVDIIQIDRIPINSLTAFFVGTCLGLFILFGRWGQAYRWREQVNVVLSLAFTICILGLYIFSRNDAGQVVGTSGLLLFLFLCLRFCFWFLSRIFRSDHFQHLSPKAVPLIEGLFHAGTVTSLLFVSLIYNDISFLNVVILDLVFQLLAGFFVLFSGTDKSLPSVPPAISTNPLTSLASVFKSRQILMGVLCFSFLTVLVQVSLFYFAGYYSEIGLSILAAFYFGLAITGLVGSQWGIGFNRNHGFLGSVTFGRQDKSLGLSGSLLFILAVTPLLFIFSFAETGHLPVFLLTALGSAAYELYALGLVEQIGQDSRQLSVDSAVAKSFGIMAVFCATSLSVFQVMKLSSFQVLLVALVLALIVFVSFRGMRLSSNGGR